MSHRVYGLIGVGVLLAAVGCGSNPATPTTGTGGSATGATSGTASIAAPRPLAPANGAQVKYSDQPVTLSAANAITTTSGAVTYTFEVASDAAFGNKFQTKDGVAQGANGQTSVNLDTLPGSSDYYWHVRATGGGTSGIFGPVFKFTMGPAIIIGTPTPIAPLSGAGAQTSFRPTFRALNASRQGTNNPTTYKFEISASSSFNPDVTSGTVAEGSVETDFIPAVDLPANVNLFWRVTASDAADSVSGGTTAPQSFSVNPPPSQASIVAAKLGIVLWPGAQPPGTNGHAVMGTDWNVEPLVSFTGVTFLNPPVDELQIFDLLDRGMQPQDAIDWMHSNGYPTAAIWEPAITVIGFQFQYIALVNGEWDMVLRSGG